MKRRLTIVAVILAIGLLAGGCALFTPPEPDLILNVPEFGYPPCSVTLAALGPVGGQYTFEVEGETYQQPGNTLTVTIQELPCVVTVTWDDGGVPQDAEATIGLKNSGPVIGNPMLNGISNLWVIHPESRYTVTFPDAYDPEGGPVTLVDVTVFHEGQDEFNTVFCPPYTGMNPPKPDLYRVRTGQGDVLNAFVFYSIWNGDVTDAVYLYPEWDYLIKYMVGDKVRVEIEEEWIVYEAKRRSKDKKPGEYEDWEYWWEELGLTEAVNNVLPYSPPSQQESGYPGAPASCGPQWPREFIASGDTVITATFEDEMGATTTESWSIPTMEHPACN